MSGIFDPENKVMQIGVKFADLLIVGDGQAQRLHLQRVVCAQGFTRADAGIHRDAEALTQHAKTRDVVDMLVSDQHGTNAAGVNFACPKRPFDPTRADARIDKKTAVATADVKTVAAAAAE